MSHRHLGISLLILGTASGLLAMGCDFFAAQPINQGCQTDADCGEFKVCHLGDGICLCVADGACDPGEFCNPKGFCQARAGCIDNSECEAPNFCDVTSGECLDPRDQTFHCSLDTHCPFGFSCEGGVCAPGCRDSSDCPLRCCPDDSCTDACIADGTCTERCGCVMHSCVAGGCQDRADCLFGQRCVDGRCEDALDSHTCADCSGTWARLDCDSSGNYECLINDTFDEAKPSTAPSEYCTPKCEVDADCPWGFSCNSIYGVPSDWRCTRGDTCPNGTACDVRSEANEGFCRCVDDSECREYGMDVCEDGGCVVSRACGIFSNLQCVDIGVTP